MTGAGGVVGLALVACFLFSSAAMLQQRASHSGPGRTGGVAGLRALMAHVVRSPLWTLGFLINLGGFVVQGMALQRGSVTLVQPLMPTQLLFAVLFAAWTAKRWPALVDWVCSLSVVAGVAVILDSAAAHPVNPEAALDRVPFVVGGAVVVVLTALVVAHGRSPRFAALATALAAGTTFATTAVFLKLTVDRLAEPQWWHVLSWPLLGLICSTTIATLLTQAAFAAGPLPWAVAVMTMVNPIASYLGGVLAFHAVPPHASTALLSATLLVVGIVGLVRSRSAHGWSPLAEATA